MFDTSKRKNDEKRKRRSLGRRASTIGLVLLLIGGGIFWLNRPSVPYPQFPAARLYYASNGHTYTINLQTGERAAAEQPEVIIRAADPADLLAALDLMASDNHKPFEASPNGEWLVGWKHIRDRYEWELVLYDRLGQGRSRSLGVFHGFYWAEAISWPTDSQFITFSAYGPPPSLEGVGAKYEELWPVAIPTGEPVRLTANNFRDMTPSFSPGGAQIVYTSLANGHPRLYMMDLTTGESRLIVSEVYGYSPVWSPDGQWIAFTTYQFSDKNETGDIWIVRPDGTDAQSVIDGDSIRTIQAGGHKQKT